MNSEQRRILIDYRMERAKESAAAAQLLYENKMLTSAMNRIYYSLFYAVQALLVLKNVSFSKHGQVKGYFNKELDTHPMDGFDHDGVKKAFDIPDNYWVLPLSFLREAKGNRE